MFMYKCVILLCINFSGAVSGRYAHNSLHFLQAKLTSYLYFGAKYLLMAYLVPFFTSIGINPTNAGIIIGVRYMAQIIGGVLLSSFADRTKKYTSVTITAIVLSTLSIIAMSSSPMLIKGDIYDTPVNMAKNNSSQQTIDKVGDKLSSTAVNSIRGMDEFYAKVASNLSDSLRNAVITSSKGRDQPITSSNYFATSTLKNTDQQPKTVNSSLINNSTSTGPRNLIHIFKPFVFYTSLSCCMIYAIFDGCLNGIVDAVTISCCNTYGNENSYYWQRLWGSVGYATVPLLASVFLENWPLYFVSTYMPVIYMFTLFQIVLLFPMMFLVREFNSIQISEDEKYVQNEKKNTINKIRKTLAKSEVIVSLTLQIFFGIGTGIEFSYLLLYMQNHLSNGSTSVLGFAVLAQCLTEAIFAPVIGRIRKVIKDPFVCMFIGVIGYSIGFFLYYLANNAYYIIAINLIFGISYVLFNFPAQAECFRLSSKECLGFIFSLSASCYTGIGCSIGGILGGILYDMTGPHYMYLITSIMFQVAAVLLLIYSFKRPKL